MNLRSLSLGYSPCPNDTFIFYALVHGRIKIPGIHIVERLEDVETLNQAARQGLLDLTKISYHALGHLREHYALLRSGGALGRGCGPLVVARSACSMAELHDKTIAVPGLLTTANLLLQLHGSGYQKLAVMPFDRIMDAVATGAVAAGVIIHESRFTYPEHGLHAIEDLGAWWEQETRLPIPLGGILARRELGTPLIRQLEEAIRRSLDFAWAHPEEPRHYIRSHAQELAEDVIAKHIGLYVNDFSRDLGAEGEAAVRELFRRAERQRIIPSSDLPLFV